MAFFLTPRLAQAYQAPQCSPMSCHAPVARPAYGYRVSHPQPRRPQYSSFDQFVSQINELLMSEVGSEAQHQAKLEAQQQAQLEAQQQAQLEAQQQARLEAQHQAELKAHIELQREAHRQRQQRKLALRARFAVSQIEQGWQVVGDIQGFEQENINIELTDEHTLKISGNTEWQSEKPATVESATSAIEQSTPADVDESAQGVALNDHVADDATEAEATTLRSASPDSDTESHKSYQATVEDDYDDLAAEFPSTSRPIPAVQTMEPENEHTSVEAPAKTEVPAAPQPKEPSQPQQTQEEERVHGTFEKSFRFPERIDVANVGASFKEGVLRIIVPKASVEQVRRIAIL